jgi:hypothetical protein
MKVEKTQICEVLRDAKKTGDCKKYIIGASGRGQYDCSYDAPCEIRKGNDIIATMEEFWSGDNYSGYCYRAYITIGELSMRLYYLPENIKKWIDGLPFVDEAEEIAKEF